MFHISFENGTSLLPGEPDSLWNAVGVRMLNQLLQGSFADVQTNYVADPRIVFELVAAAENVDLNNDFTRILVVDRIQQALKTDDDSKNKNSDFYKLMGSIANLSLMLRHPSETKGEHLG